MADFLLAAIKTLALPMDDPSSPGAEEASSPRLSNRISPTTQIPSTPNDAQTSIYLTNSPSEVQISNEAFVDVDTSRYVEHPKEASAPENVETPNQLTVALVSSVPHSQLGPADEDTQPGVLEVVPNTVVALPNTTIASTDQNPDIFKIPTQEDIEFNFHFVPFEDATESEEWLLVPEDFQAFTNTDDGPNSEISLTDSLDCDFEQKSANDDVTASDLQPNQKIGSFESLELDNDVGINSQEALCNENFNVSSARSTSPLISLPSSKNDSEDFDFPETCETASETSESSDSNSVSFKELFGDPKSEELNWEDDHFQDCENELESDMNESFYSEQGSEPLLPVEEISSTSESLRMLFYEKESHQDEGDYKTLDVVEVLQPADFKPGSSGYPVHDLPILEGNFFQLADTPPKEGEISSSNFQTSNETMFLFEIPPKLNEDACVQDKGTNMFTSFDSRHEFNKCDIVFGDFDSSHPLTPCKTEDFSDCCSSAYSSRTSPPLSSHNSTSLSFLLPVEGTSSTSSDCSSMSCSSPTLSSDFLPRLENFSAYNDDDHQDSLEEKCFKFHEDDDYGASFDCFPMRLQSARKVDYRGCGTRKTRRRRKRW